MIAETHYIMESVPLLVGCHASTMLKHFLEKLARGGGEQQKNPNTTKKKLQQKKPQTKLENPALNNSFRAAACFS